MLIRCRWVNRVLIGRRRGPISRHPRRCCRTSRRRSHRPIGPRNIRQRIIRILSCARQCRIGRVVLRRVGYRSGVGFFVPPRKAIPRWAACAAAYADRRKNHHRDPASSGSHGRKHLNLFRVLEGRFRPPSTSLSNASAGGILVPEDVKQTRYDLTWTARGVRPSPPYS